MNKTKKIAIASATGAALLVPGYGSMAFAADCTSTTDSKSAIQCGVTAANPDTGSKDLPTRFKDIANLLLIIIGIVSVIMLIVGGFRYVLSAGNSSSVEGAKNTLLVAIIGVIVALIAGSIINFVIAGVGK